jgi:hypothetical protein
MNRTLCYCSPAYGAMMHALPRDASALKRMTEKQMFDQASPWVNRVPPQTEHQLDTWTVKAVNPTATGLGDLGDLAELSGLKKKLKKVAKKVTSSVKKVAKKVVAVHKKVGKALTSKKLAKPFAFVLGAATGTLPAMMKLNTLREKVRATKKAAQAQTGMTDAQIEAEAEAEAQAQLRAEEQAQAAPAYQEPAPQYQAPQQSFAPVQPQYTPPAAPAPAPQYQAPPAPRQTFAPAPVQYEQPQYQAPQQTFAPAAVDPFANFNNVQRLAPADDEQEEKPKIVGLSTAGIMQSIKANPIPWTVGGLGLGFVLYRAMNPSQRQRAY